MLKKLWHFLFYSIDCEKGEFFKINNRIFFEITVDNEVVMGDIPCRWAMRYRSVMGNGTVTFIEDPFERRFALDRIMMQYGGPSAEDYPGMESIALFRVDIAEMTGKESLPGYRGQD